MVDRSAVVADVSNLLWSRLGRLVCRGRKAGQFGNGAFPGIVPQRRIVKDLDIPDGAASTVGFGEVKHLGLC